MQKKTILITGSSSGFGKLAALALAERGHRVLAAVRNPVKGEALLSAAGESAGNIQLIHLDVTSSPSVAALSAILTEHDRIDALINNAGFAYGGFAEEVTADGFREQFETNFFGVLAVTDTVLPFMRKQKSGKILNMSSISGLIGFPGLSPYVSSKHALEGYSESLRLELNPFGIDVALIEPGSFSTGIWTTGRKVSFLEESPYSDYMQAIENELNRSSQQHGDPQEVARLLVHLCEKDKLHKLRYPIGRGVKMTAALKRVLPWRVWERIVLKKLGMQ
ncbi:SDR family oxidoreductase [Bacillus mangrovi]|uniref:SDR family oxidoreductase n=1 Tax=Metabacillus mangrovi TaxID=1491830 RepID=A0A7X2V3Q4_9BACI|nr:SDR family oxidoreductase [Metabacillus mangrovi]MTH52276.1 SDR family oxidoreductase [Metabacillus mangrovi]